MPTGIEEVFGLIAAAGFVLWVLSLIFHFIVVDLHKLYAWLTRSNRPLTVRATMEEMYEEVPYAAARNAKQALTKRRLP